MLDFMRVRELFGLRLKLFICWLQSGTGADSWMKACCLCTFIPRHFCGHLIVEMKLNCISNVPAC